MSDAVPSPPPDLEVLLRIDQACERFERAWKAASLTRGRPRIEDCLADAPEPEQAALLRELILIEVFHRRRIGEAPRRKGYLGRFPVLDSAWLDQVVGAALTADPAADLVGALFRYPLLLPAHLDELPRLQCLFAIPHLLAVELRRRGWLTSFQIEQLLQGKGGELLLGPYVMLEQLGEGGMGTVYRARHAGLNKVVALKVIRRDHVASEEAVRRFHREIRAASQLSHPNIAHAFEAEQAGDTHYFTMELIDGIDLARVLKQRGSLPVAEACEYARQAALGLQHAYEKGLLHLSVKPSNLLLTSGVQQPAKGAVSGGSPPPLSESNTVKLLDLGLSHMAVREGESSTKLTAPGAVFGTADYIAPEQTDATHTVDIRADVYSLGCTFYHLLSGGVPFPGGTFQQKTIKHRHEEPTPLEQLRPEVPPAVRAVVRKLMAKRAEDRYQTPGEVASALTRVLREQARNAGSPNADFQDERGRGQQARSPWQLVTAVAIAVLVSALAGVLLLRM